VTSFPKKHLIEEFTGQTCGYCPSGMDNIHSFVGNDSSFVTILHHYGYSPDNFSVKGSNTITTALGVSGAPNMCLNRAPYTFKDEYGRSKSPVVFHPGYLQNSDRTQLEATTYASIILKNTYDPETRVLTVRVNGQVLKEDASTLKLTVLLKESGMIDTQADYNKTFEGWQEFRHVNAVRAFMSNPEGDNLMIKDKAYNDVFSVTLDGKWVPENCMVVAFLADGFKPVIQAEQAPVIAGTKGGADILHGGITPVPVPDYYPEIDATHGPHYFSHHETDTLPYSIASVKAYPEYNFNYWQVQAYDFSADISVNRVSCVPLVNFYFFTELNPAPTAVPTGSSPFNSSYELNTAEAGIRDDEKLYIGGSLFYYAVKSYITQGIYPMAEWLIADGELTITATGWTISGHARNGAEIHLVGSTPIRFSGNSSAPLRTPRRAHLQTAGFDQICR
jgi:hypothetical protein